MRSAANGIRSAFRALAWWLILISAAAAQAPSSSAPKALAGNLVGTWELSNAERDRTCTLGLKGNVSGSGFALEWDRACAERFPFTREVVAWKIGAGDALRLVAGGGRTVIELTEVEGGLYEGERPGHGLVFLQSIAASGAEERKAEQIVGDWAFQYGPGRPICQVTLSAQAAAQDALALAVKPGCDPMVARFGPVAWRLDRGQIVLIPAKGASWRFEEVDTVTWRRIPEGRQPLQLVRQ